MEVIKNLSLIVALGQNREIGRNQNLIWRINEDLDFFKRTTMNSHIIMGKNTYESMPKNLRGRKYIVLSKDKDFKLKENQKLFNSLEEVIFFIKNNPSLNFIIIGGGMVYRLFLPYVEKMYITEIKATCEDADTFFPDFDKSNWNINAEEELYCEQNGVSYRHTLYLRK